MPVRAALYLDFDNIFSGLMQADPEAGLAVAQNPSLWLERLSTRHQLDGPRSWLVRRCYMNPAGHVYQRNGVKHTFASFRPFFTRAGFEVIDCPSLTSSSKNAADIRIVLDAVDALGMPTRYDEFVIASSDSDFTPLLQRLRAADRRTTVIATQTTSVAYEAMADQLLDEQDFVDLLADDPEPAGAAGLVVPAEAVAGAAPGNGGGNGALDDSPDVARFREFLSAELAAADRPVHLSALGVRARELMGDVIERTDWFGAHSLSAAVRRLRLDGVAVGPREMWDVARHEAPEQPGPALPAAVAHCCDVVDLPRIPSAVWPNVFEALATYAATHEFNLTESTRWSRDLLLERGVEVGRGVFGYVLRGARAAGCHLDQDEAPTDGEIGRAFLRSLLSRSANAGLDLSPPEVAQVAAWLGLPPDPVPPRGGPA